MFVKITKSNEAPPNPGGGYRNYIAGNIYGPGTDPPGTPALVKRAVAEGWGEHYPPLPAAGPLLADMVAEVLGLDDEPPVGDLTDAPAELLLTPDERADLPSLDQLGAALDAVVAEEIVEVTEVFTELFEPFPPAPPARPAPPRREFGRTTGLTKPAKKGRK